MNKVSKTVLAAQAMGLQERILNLLESVDNRDSAKKNRLQLLYDKAMFRAIRRKFRAEFHKFWWDAPFKRPLLNKPF